MSRTGIGYVRIDPAAVDAELLQRNLTETDLIDGGVGRASIARIYSLERVQRHTARKLMKVLGLDPQVALHRFLLSDESHSQVQNGSLQSDNNRETQLGPWICDGRPTAWLTTSNGLQYRVFRMRHSLLPDLFGRGKCYDLTQFDEQTRERMIESLIRHPHVCRQLESHPAFPRNEFAGFADERHFWVIDRAETGETLQSRVETGSLEKPELASVMTQLASALVAMHKIDIIRRELTPSAILLRPNGNVLLTDLELSKLTAERPSVSQGRLKASRWLAPEIDAPHIDASVDVYSWGKIFLFAATGCVPAEIIDSQKLTLPKVPKRVLEIVRSAVSASYQFRPHTQKILNVMQTWKAK